MCAGKWVLTWVWVRLGKKTPCVLWGIHWGKKSFWDEMGGGISGAKEGMVLLCWGVGVELDWQGIVLVC